MNWLLLRGLSREQRHWGPLPAMIEAATGHKVFRLDLPGTGTEHKRASPASVAGIVSDLRERWMPLRDANAGPWGILGISLGGMVTMGWSGTFSGDFSRVVICNTSAGNLSPPWHRMDLSVAPRVIRAMLDSDAVRRERNILAMTTNVAKDNEERALAWSKFQDDAPIARATVVRQILAGMRFRAPGKISSPVLILSSAKDGFTSPECCKRLADHFGAEMRVHPEASHDLGTDAPEWMVAQLKGWLGA